jgi:inner membrane protein
MDNLTHTLVGTLVGDTAARFTSNANSGLPADTRRNFWVGMMAVGSNLPDADFIYPMLSGSKLAYLSEHRGHTHTVIGALIAAALMWLVCECVLRRRGFKLSFHDRYGLIGIALLAPLLHIAMDFTTSYGVHPFWPFDNRWYYGDAVFIIEPLFWAACAPLAFVLKTRIARVLIVVVLIIGIALSMSTKMVPPSLSFMLAALTLTMLAVGKLARPKFALMTSVAVWLSITVLFTFAHRVAEGRALAISSEQFPQARVLDQSLTPLPVNPLCWAVIQPQLEGEEYVLRSAMLSLAPSLLPADACPMRTPVTQLTAPLKPVAAAHRADWRWLGEIRMPRDQLHTLAVRYCEADVLLHFARTPWASVIEDRWILGDLRYDREPGLGFAEIELQDTSTCSRVPPWLPPRNDLLSDLPG